MRRSGIDSKDNRTSILSTREPGRQEHPGLNSQKRSQWPKFLFFSLILLSASLLLNGATQESCVCSAIGHVDSRSGYCYDNAKSLYHGNLYRANQRADRTKFIRLPDHWYHSSRWNCSRDRTLASRGMDPDPVQNGPRGTGWVYAANVSLSPGTLLPIVEPPPTPTPVTTPTHNPTFVAAFQMLPTSTRLPTFTPPPSLVIPTFTNPAKSSDGRAITTWVIVLLGLIGIAGICLYFRTTPLRQPCCSHF